MTVNVKTVEDFILSFDIRRIVIKIYEIIESSLRKNTDLLSFLLLKCLEIQVLALEPWDR